MKPVHQIFYTLQGEGRNTGRAAVFVRFSGCNLHCPFCDTVHDSFEPMSDEAIVEAVSAFPARLVVLTGGEPALYVDQHLVEAFHERGFEVAMETNGTRPLAPGIDWITVSPKDDDCGPCDVVVSKAHEVKVVYVGQDVERYRTAIEADYYYLQPCDFGDDPRTQQSLNDCVAYCMEHPHWRLSLQTHKMINIP